MKGATLYAKSGDLRIAYQVHGDGPIDPLLRADGVVSSTVKDLVVGSGIAFVDRGAQALKGVPGEWQLYAVDGAASGA